MVQSRFPDQKPNSTFTFGTNLNRAGRLWRTVFRALAGLNGRPTSYISVMSYLITGAEGATQKELATLMGADAPTVVRVLDVLEREGIVERRIREADRRSKSVHFTEAGAACAEAFRRAGEQTSAQLLAGCDPADIEAAVRVFRRITENAECVRIPD
jgi:MarR family transcriptional regulator for hemolysin